MNSELVPFAREALEHALGNFYLNEPEVIEAVSTYLVTGAADSRVLWNHCGYPEPRRNGDLDKHVVIVLGFLCGTWTGERYNIPASVYVESLRSYMKLSNLNQFPRT